MGGGGRDKDGAAQASTGTCFGGVVGCLLLADPPIFLVLSSGHRSSTVFFWRVGKTGSSEPPERVRSSRSAQQNYGGVVVVFASRLL